MDLEKRFRLEVQKREQRTYERVGIIFDKVTKDERFMLVTVIVCMVILTVGIIVYFGR